MKKKKPKVDLKLCVRCGREFDKSVRRSTCSQECHYEVVREKAIAKMESTGERRNKFLPIDAPENVLNFWVPSPEEIAIEAKKIRESMFRRSLGKKELLKHG